MLSPPRNRGFRSCPRGGSHFCLWEGFARVPSEAPFVSLQRLRWCPVGGFAGIPTEALLGSLGRLRFDPKGGLAGVLRRGEALYLEGGIVGLRSGNGMSGLGRVRYLCALLRSVSPACVLH